MGPDAGRWRAWAAAALLLGGCATTAGPARPGPEASAGPEQALRRFLAAAGEGDFARAHALLSARWRERVSPARLAADFEREPLARRRLELAAAAGPVRQEGGRAVLPVGPGRAVVLVEEGGAWKVDRLE